MITHVIKKIFKAAVFRFLFRNVEVVCEVESSVVLRGLRTITKAQGQDLGPAALQ